MGSTLSLIVITTTLFNVKYVFADCKCNDDRPDDFKEAVESRFRKCLQLIKDGTDCTWNHECVCEITPESFDLHDHDKCETEWKALPHACYWFSPADDQPQIHAITPDHCVLAAHWAVAVNLGKLNPTDPDWSEDVWNARAKELDLPFTTEKTWIPGASMGGTYKAEKTSFLQTFKKWDRKSNGAFGFVFAQMMLQTVGLNYGSDASRTYPAKYERSLFKVERLETYGWNTPDDFLKVLNGKTKFRNSQNDEKQMVALILGINTHPWLSEITKKEKKKGKTSAPQYNHAVAVVPYGDPPQWYYLDSNAPDIQPLGAGDPIPLVSVYQDLTHGSVEFTNVKGETKYKWHHGYLVDPSINLGSDLAIVAKWLYEKCKVRPMCVPNDDTAPGACGDDIDGKVTDSKGIPIDTGGALHFHVIVEDEVTPFEVTKQKYVPKGKEGTDEWKASIKELVQEQHDHWAHVGYQDHYNMHWNKGKEESEYDTDRESINASGSESPFLIGGVVGASVVVIITLIFCLGLAFGIVICWGYTQKKALDLKRGKEETDNDNSV